MSRFRDISHGPRRAGLLSAGLALLLAAGCRAPAEPTGPTEILLRVPDRDAFFDASLSLLRRYDLPPERVDRERGLIVTRRTTSKQWFEPWRVDAPGGYQVLESSLSTVGRVVTITLEPAGPEATLPDELGTGVRGPAAPGGASPAPAGDADGSYRLTVRVDKARYSAPERQVTTASGAMAMFSEQMPTTEGLRGPESRTVRWVPLGRDALLEGLLLARLVDLRPEVEVLD